jgi:hypothetical protein
LVKATLETVTIYHGVNVVASHARTFDKGAQIESETHKADLSARKKQARHHIAVNFASHLLLNAAVTFLMRQPSVGIPFAP